MMQSAIVQQILGAIFGFQYLVDIIIGIFLLIAFFIGVKRGLWRSLWRLIFVVIALVLVNIFALPALGDFVNQGFWALTGMGITMDIGGTAVSFNSVQELVIGFAAYAEGVGTLSPASIYADEAFLISLSLALSRAIGWFVVAMVTMVIGWLVSGLLWLVIWKPLLKSLAKKKIGIVGGVLGLAQGYLYVLMFTIAFSPLTAGLAAIQNPTEPPYQFGEVLPLASGGLRPENSLLLSITTPSNPFGFFTSIASFEHDGTTYDLVSTFVAFVEATDTPAS